MDIYIIQQTDTLLFIYIRLFCYI